MAFTGMTGQQLQETLAQAEAMLKEREQALTRMYEAYQQGRLGQADYQQFMAACAEYQALLARYQQLASGR
jgi:hypothetical protein